MRLVGPVTNQTAVASGVKAFRAAWKLLERRGWCDDIDGCEYERVLFDWCGANKPEPLAFIREVANTLPPAH